MTGRNAYSAQERVVNDGGIRGLRKVGKNWRARVAINDGLCKSSGQVKTTKTHPTVCDEGEPGRKSVAKRRREGNNLTGLVEKGKETVMETVAEVDPAREAAASKGNIRRTNGHK